MAQKDEIVVLSWREHAKTKEMWAGALVPTRNPDLLGVRVDGEGAETLASLKDSRLTPALLQIVREALTNASDHHRDMLRLGRGKDRVTSIAVHFDAASGEFRVENDGRGFAVYEHAGGTKSVGYPVRVPEVACMVSLAGSNMDKPEDCVKGGTNGLGLKLLVVHSARVRLETVGADLDGSLLGYVQSFRDRASKRTAPALYGLRTAAARAALATTEPHTHIAFTPAYEALGHVGPLSLANTAADLEAWCRWQVYLTAAYVGPGVAVSFNGTRCELTSAEALARFVAGGDPAAQVFPFPMKSKAEPQKSNPWQVVAAILPGSTGKAVRNIAVVNGVFCPRGAHIRYLRDLLGSKIAEKMARLAGAKKDAKKVSIPDACQHLTLFVVAPIPGAAWNSQNKLTLDIPRALLASYAAAPTVLSRVADAIANYNTVLLERKGKRATRKRVVKVEKYLPARRAGSVKSSQCALMLAEGDSAMRPLQAGLTLGKKNPGGPTFEYYGLFSLGGVIINALRNVKPVIGPDGRRCHVRSKQLKANKRLTALEEVLGLSHACTYETAEERAGLRYGQVIIATDQDLDGTGKILPLVLVYFHTFWPALFDCGFVRRYITPVIRAYPKARGGRERAVEFFYEDAFRVWAATVDLGLYTVDYYKGLASHSIKEIGRMFPQFHANVIRLTRDPEAGRNFVAFYDTPTAARKRILSTPVVFPTVAAAAAERAAQAATCSDLMNVDAKAYKLDDLSRKLASPVDGLMVARRKILAGAMRCFRASNTKKKVFQLGGYVADHMAYHHGSDPLNGGIVRLAQRFPGAGNFPPLVGVGMFGTRHAGGKDAGSPRYIDVRLAAPYVNAMFPPVDTCLLPYVFEDGVRAQPHYFVPVLPTVLLESHALPAEGWRYKSVARELDDVVAIVRAFIAGDPAVAAAAAAAEAHPECSSFRALVGSGALARDAARDFFARFPLRTSLRGYGAHLAPAERARLLRGRVNKRGKPFFATCGAYALSETRGRTVVHITELPIGMSTQSFVAKKLEPLVRCAKCPQGLVQGFINESPVLEINIRVVLVAGGLEAIGALFPNADDPVLDYFRLFDDLHPYLNMYTPEGRVREFDGDYRAALFAWVPYRRDLYRARFERAEVLLDLRARLEEATVRYIDEADDIALARHADEAAAVAALAAREFPVFDAGLLREPRYASAADIAARATAGPKASHSYILNLKERELIKTAREKRVAKAAALRAELAAVREALAETPFAGASAWAAEVDAVVAAIAAGEKCGWWSDN